MNDATRHSLDTVFAMAPIAAPANVVLGEVVESREVADTQTGEILMMTGTTGTALAIPDADERSQEEIQAQEDYEFSRGAIKAIAVEAQTTLSRAVDAAVQTDTARAFEAVADMIRASLESHRELQGLHKTAAEIRAATSVARTPPGTVNIQQGVVFTGTSEELLRLIAPDRT